MRPMTTATLLLIGGMAWLFSERPASASGNGSSPGDDREVIYVAVNDEGELVHQRLSQGADGIIRGVEVTDIIFRSLDDIDLDPNPGPGPNPDPDDDVGRILTEMTNELADLTMEAVDDSGEKGPDIANGIVVLLRETRLALEEADDPRLGQVPNAARRAVRLSAGVRLREWQEVHDRIDTAVLDLDQLNEGLTTKAENVAFLLAIENGIRGGLPLNQRKWIDAQAIGALGGLEPEVQELFSEDFILRLIELFLPILLELIGIF